MKNCANATLQSNSVNSHHYNYSTRNPVDSMFNPFCPTIVVNIVLSTNCKSAQIS